MLEVKYIVTHTRLIKTETCICNLDRHIHQDCGISETSKGEMLKNFGCASDHLKL